jgi:hypothetical protein
MTDDQELTDKRVAFFTILAAAVLIDGEEKPDERAELDALTVRTKTLSKLKQPARDELFTKVVPSLKRNFEADITRWDRIDRACADLLALEPQNAGLCHSVYLHAVDLAHADRDLLTSEDIFLQRLESKFGVANPAQARALIKSKNAY